MRDWLIPKMEKKKKKKKKFCGVMGVVLKIQNMKK